MITLTAVLYFLGIFLHYVHVVTVGSFTSIGELDNRKVVLFSVVWPAMTCWYFYVLVLTREDD